MGYEAVEHYIEAEQITHYEFAKRFSVPIATVYSWRSGRRKISLRSARLIEIMSDGALKVADMMDENVVTEEELRQQTLRFIKNKMKMQRDRKHKVPSFFRKVKKLLDEDEK